MFYLDKAGLTRLWANIKAKIPTKVSQLSNDSGYSTSEQVISAVSTKAPTSHASTGSAYGLGTTANHGHVKTINALTQTSHVDGTALSAYQGKVLNDKIESITSTPNGLPKIKTIPINETYVPENDNKFEKLIALMPPSQFVAYDKITLEVDGSFTYFMDSYPLDRAYVDLDIVGSSIHCSFFSYDPQSAVSSGANKYVINDKILFELVKSSTYIKSSSNEKVTQYHDMIRNFGFIDDEDLSFKVTIGGKSQTNKIVCNFNINIYAK